jgi:hypothetical protein
MGQHACCMWGSPILAIVTILAILAIPLQMSSW